MRQFGWPNLMHRFARQAIAATFTAFYAAVMVCGPCLHGLPGGGHAPRLAARSDTGSTRDPIGSVQPQPDDCVVCHVVAQAQLPTAPARARGDGLVRVLNHVPRSGIWASTLINTAFPRGPPGVVHSACGTSSNDPCPFPNGPAWTVRR